MLKIIKLNHICIILFNFFEIFIQKSMRENKKSSITMMRLLLNDDLIGPEVVHALTNFKICV